MPTAVYGAWRVREARDAGHCYIVEGETDCMVLWYHGLPALGVPGASSAKVLTEELLAGVPILYVVRELGRSGDTFIPAVKNRLELIGWGGLAFELRMPDGLDDPADLHCQDPNRFKERLADAIEQAPPLSGEEYPQGDAWEQRHSGNGREKKSAREPNSRREIWVTPDEHLVNDEAVEALATDNTIYQRGGQLVHVIRDSSPAAEGLRRPLAPRIEPLPKPLVRERLAASACWLLATNDVDYKQVRPPAWCIEAVHARGTWPGISHLEGVIDCPVLRPDGTILDRPGYDAKLGLLLEPTCPLPAIADQPTRADALAARDVLNEVVTDFPFERPEHAAAWLAALLTPLARFAFAGPAPLFLVDANVRAAGKGLLLQCIAQIVTGKEFAVASYNEDDDELRKLVTSLALAGDRLVLFDNIEGHFGSAVLDRALTGTTWKDRLLNTNRTAEMGLYMTWYATGNNVIAAADTARRICHCRLESPEEWPEERSQFRHSNLLSWVGANRGRLFVAALTILRAYCVAGRPDMHLQAWGSFEGWSQLVRSAIVWLDLPDPGCTRVFFQDSADPTAKTMGRLLRYWEQLPGSASGLTAAEVIKIYEQPPQPCPEWYAGLVEALDELLSKADARSLGNKLKKYRRTILGDRFIDVVGEENRAKRWRVYPATEFRRESKHTRPHSSDSSAEAVSRPADRDTPPAGMSLTSVDESNPGPGGHRTPFDSEQD
jgi:hypothetical protein